MIFISIFIAVAVVYLIERYIYNKHSFDDLEYKTSVSTPEVFEGEDIFMYEEISNNKRLPLPNVKVETELPQGLEFRLSDRNAVQIQQNISGSKSRKKRAEVYQSNIQSIFVMTGYQKIRRRWRVTCLKRGVYHLGSVIAVTNDLVGLNAQSKRFTAENEKQNKVIVLPKTIDLDEYFVSSYLANGDVAVPHSMVSDPLYISGSRDYTTFDPMNKINWKSSAVHGKLMVNIEEFTEVNQFNIILNMQSRDREKNISDPSTPEYVELCITVCASILDRMAVTDVPVRFFANTPPEAAGEKSVSDDEIGRKILITRFYRGKGDALEALRMFAALQMKISCPVENMLDHIVNNPDYYSNGGNIIMVTPFLNERMINFNDAMIKHGMKVMFYVTTANQNALVIPDTVNVKYKTHK